MRFPSARWHIQVCWQGGRERGRGRERERERIEEAFSLSPFSAEGYLKEAVSLSRQMGCFVP